MRNLISEQKPEAVVEIKIYEMGIKFCIFEKF